MIYHRDKTFYSILQRCFAFQKRCGSSKTKWTGRDGTRTTGEILLNVCVQYLSVKFDDWFFCFSTSSEDHPYLKWSVSTVAAPVNQARPCALEAVAAAVRKGENALVVVGSSVRRAVVEPTKFAKKFLEAPVRKNIVILCLETDSCSSFFLFLFGRDLP